MARLGLDVPRVVWLGGIVAAAFLVVACGDRAPALRHDWTWFPFVAAPLDVFWSAAGGWWPDGIGGFAAYAPWFLPGWCFAALRTVFPPDAVATLGFASAGAIAYAAAVTVARNARAPALLATIAGLAVLASPWIYDELVAGHLFMIAAAAGLAAYAATVAGGRDTRLRWLVLASFQVQFFVPALILAIGLGVRRRRFRPDLIVALALALPSIIGFLGGYRGVAGIPLTLAWELDQSVSPVLAWIGRGYFAAYDHALSFWASLGAVALIALAGWGVARRRSAFSYGALIVFVGTTLFAMGLRGPLWPLFRLGFVAFPPLGLYRELFDVVGLAQYALIGAVAWSDRSIARVGLLIAPLVVVAGVAWVVSPPRAFWVPAGDLPRVEVPSAPPGGRFALLPPFQPLMWEGRGSGIDPDDMPHGLQSSPLNLYVPGFPVDVALARLARGDSRLAARLGASVVQSRPWLQPEPIGQAGQVAVEPRLAPLPPRLQLAGVTPLFAQGGAPRDETVGNTLGGGRLVSDEDAPLDERRIRRRSVELDWSRQWVDMALVERAFPDFGSAFGGVATSGPTPLDLTFGATQSVLVAVRGTLREDRTAHTFRDLRRLSWVPLSVPDGVTRWTCHGICAIAASSSTDLSRLPAEVPPLPRRALPSTPFTPWLYAVHPAYGGAPVLYFNMTYDDGWIAVTNTLLRHWRIDGVTNAWSLGDAPAGTVLVLHLTSLLQFIAELAAVVVLVCIAVGARAGGGAPLVGESGAKK